jgi:hypothetical protein
MRRPQLLIRAARIGMQDYNRDRDLRRLTGQSSTPSPVNAIKALLEAEGAVESTRQAGDASYSVMRHVDLLIALMAETNGLPRTP